ncbi:MAG TPA: VWA domain-containing protein, partial [Anaerolineae bacterium]|nr:VWA domain-containing protein [Anaerolineae bacterium]
MAQAQSTVAEVVITHIEAQAKETGEVLVSALVSALDAEGQPVPGLTADNFTLSENNLPIDKSLMTVSPADEPLRVTLLVDTSSQMAQPGPDGVRAIDAAKDALVSLIETLNEGDQVAIYDFNSQVRRQQDFTHDHNLAIDQGLLQLNARESEPACLLDALLQVIDPLAAQSAGPQVLIALTGSPIDETCSGTTVDDVLDVAATAGNSMPIFVVAFGDTLNEEELLRFNRSGGRALSTPDATGLTGLLNTLSTQLKNQYKISYPTQAPVGLATIIIFENSSEQSDRRQVLIPQRIEPTPTPLPQFTLGLNIEQPATDKVIIRVDAPENITLVTSELFINNKLIEKIVSPPFDQFEVDINELGSGKHTVRVEAMDENGVAASAEVELTLTIPPTPAPTIPPTPQPTPTASPSSVLNGGVTIPALALILIIVGLVLLLILMGLVAYFLFFRAKQPVVQVMPPASPSPPSI